MPARPMLVPMLLTLVASSACLAHEGIESDSVTEINSLQNRAGYTSELAATPTAVEQCSGKATSPEGERCVETFENEGVVRCQYTARRALSENDRDRNEIDSVFLELEPSGAFVFMLEEVAEENRVMDGRKIFTTSKLTTEYRESSDGVGTCHQPDGLSSPCERDSKLLGIGDDPCTSRYLSVATR